MSRSHLIIVRRRAPVLRVPPGGAAPITWEDGTYTLSAPGTYSFSGRYLRNLSPSVPLFNITHPGVILDLQGCGTWSRHFTIQSSAACTVVLNNNRHFADNPRVNGQSAKRITTGSFGSLTATNLDLRGSGLHLSGATPSKVHVRRCRFKDIMGMYSNGTDGMELANYLTQTVNYSSGERERRQALQLASVGEIADLIVDDNHVDNRFGGDPNCIEDTFSAIASGGTAGNPGKYWNNFVRGGQPTRPFDLSFSGYGFQNEYGAAHLDYYRNVVVGHTQAGIGADSSSSPSNPYHDISVRECRVIHAAKIGGVQTYVQSANGFQFVYPGAAPYGITLQDNYSQWWHSQAGANYNNLSALTGTSGYSNTGMTVAGARASEADYDTEEAAWHAARIAAGISLGSTVPAWW